MADGEGNERITSEQVPQVERLALWSHLLQLDEDDPYLQNVQWFVAPVDDRVSSPSRELNQIR